MKPRILVLLLVAGWSSFMLADAAPISLSEYRLQLDHYGSELQEITRQPAHAVDLNRDAAPSFQVQTQAGVIHVPLEFLHQGLEKYLTSVPAQRASILSSLAERIKGMRQEADNFEHGQAADTAARERLNQILATREFAAVRGPTQFELLQQRINAWLQEKLNKIFPEAPDLDQLGQIFVWIVIATVSAILAVWLYRQSRERLADRPREVVPFLPSAKSWRWWLSQAREKAAQGDWREAIHMGFWAAVSRLESDGVWRPDKTRTPREYLDAIPAANATRPSFAAAIKTFEAAWYGRGPASASDFANFLMELEKLGCKG